jgi:hypothetical protein
LTRCDAGLIIWRREDEAQQVYHPLITPLRHARLPPHHGEGCRNSLNGAASSTPERSTRRRQLADWLEVWPRRMCPRASEYCIHPRGSESISSILHCLDCLKKLAIPTPRPPLSSNQPRNLARNGTCIIRYMHEIRRNPLQSRISPNPGLQNPPFSHGCTANWKGGAVLDLARFRQRPPTFYRLGPNRESRKRQII